MKVFVKATTVDFQARTVAFAVRPPEAAFNKSFGLGVGGEASFTLAGR
jgi:hypothetical protein